MKRLKPTSNNVLCEVCHSDYAVAFCGKPLCRGCFDKLYSLDEKEGDRVKVEFT